MQLIDEIRRPEYTGDRRCWPCTVVNGVVVLAIAAVVALVRLPAAVLTLAVGAVAIALRGYVVPYTPQFAPRLVERLPVDLGFDHGSGPVRPAPDGEGEGDENPDPGSLAAEDDETGERVMVGLLEAGVLVEDETGVRPSDDFFDAWEAETADLRTLDDDALADAVADAAPFEATGEHDGTFVALEGDDAAVWLTPPIAIAEAAAVRAMVGFDVPEDLRPQAARPLRMFVETCPTCGGRVVETTVRNCCGGTRGIYDSPGQEVLACEDCESIVYEFRDLDDSDRDEDGAGA